MVYFRIQAITYDNLGRDNQQNYNKIKETNEIIINADFITTLRITTNSNRNNKTYIRHQVQVTYSNGSLGAFYISETDYNKLVVEINNNLTIVDI